MSKVIKMRLSHSSIRNAIREIEEFKQEFNFKCSLFVQRLAEIGLETINEHKYGRGDSDFNDMHTYVWLEESGTKVKATLVLAGKDVAFIEFGAGISYNGEGGSPHPYGQSLGMLIGSYGKGHGLEESWVYFDRDSGQYKTSYGTEAAMPMYYADQKIIKSFFSAAQEVFGNA